MQRSSSSRNFEGRVAAAGVHKDRLLRHAMPALLVLGISLGGASPVMAGTVRGSNAGITAALHAGTHHPTVNRPWPIQFTVTRAGRAVKASVSYEYLFGGQVVAHRSHYTFTGHFADVFKWPSSAVGEPLTFRAVIVSAKATIDLDYAVQVVR
jgi:hypothetical protein